MNALFFPFSEFVQHAAILAPISSVANLKRRSEIRTSFRRDSLSICRTGCDRGPGPERSRLSSSGFGAEYVRKSTCLQDKTQEKELEPYEGEVHLVLEESHLTS